MPRTIAGVNKHKDYLLAVLTALLLILSFPNFNLWIFAWFAFLPLFLALENKSKLRAFLLSYLAGIIFWLGIIYWLVHVTLAGLIVLILWLSVYFGLFGLAFAIGSRLSIGLQALFLPSAWVILEYARSSLSMGFPWALLGHSQSWNLAVIQISDITGAGGVSFLVMMVNVMLWKFIKRARFNYLPFLLLLLCILGYGYYKLYAQPAAGRPQLVKVSVIQGNIAQELKWNHETSNYILDKYTRLTEQSAVDAPDLIIWPEASSPEILGEDNLVFQEIFSLGKKINTPLLIGSVVCDSGRYSNSALLIMDEKITGRYDKLHLVPFGEYIPLKKILPFLVTIVPIGDIAPGKEYTIFKIPGLKSQIPNKFAVLICFEDLFPELSREFVKKGADFLVNITNDAWYKKTSAPYQHFQACVFRAVENRVYLARAANTGVSGFIDPFGRIFFQVSDESGKRIFVDGYKTEVLKIQTRPLTFYTRYGDVFIFLLCFFIVYSIFLLMLKK